MKIKGGEKFARILLLRSWKENPRDFNSIKHIVRSFYPIKLRDRIYGDQQILPSGMITEISEKFLKEIYKKPHICEFCKNSQKR